MQLKKLFNDDGAVSPVIGVILMVAITVILAAVIASFVLGLGQSGESVQPNSSFSLDNVESDEDNEEWESVVITLTDGDSIDADEIVFRGDAVDNEAFLDEVNDGGIEDDEWNVGQSIDFADAEDDESNNLLLQDDSDNAGGGSLNIVWEESGGEGSATLANFDLPELDTTSP